MKKIIIIAGIVVFLLVATGLVVFGVPGDGAAKADSGVTACQNIADRQAKPTGGGSGPMSRAAYIKALEPFEASAHSDLKVAGANFVNAAWDSQQALNTEDTDLATSFGVLNKLETTYAALQIACQNHGVTLKPLTT